jgi:hypothetical protein
MVSGIEPNEFIDPMWRNIVGTNHLRLFSSRARMQGIGRGYKDVPKGKKRAGS